MSGLLVGALWVVLVLGSDKPQWLLVGAVVGSLTILSAVSGVGSVLLARIGRQDASADVA